MTEPLKTTFLPHAVEQMEARNISKEEARATLENPDLEYFGYLGRGVAEKTFSNRRLATKVVYNRGDNQYVVITVARGRPTRREP